MFAILIIIFQQILAVISCVLGIMLMIKMALIYNWMKSYFLMQLSVYVNLAGMLSVIRFDGGRIVCHVLYHKSSL
jgi:hypothetical protein